MNGFLYARVFLGLSEAGNFPAAVKAIAMWFPKTERAFATALFNSGANVGAIGAPLLVAWLLQHWTWHAPFYIAGTAGIIWVVLWWSFYSVPQKNSLVSTSELAWIESDQSTLEPEVTTKILWTTLLRCKQTWSFVAAKFMTDPVWFFLLIWLPDYFKKTRGLDIKHSWQHLATIYIIVTVLSLMGGWITGYLAQVGMERYPCTQDGHVLLCIAGHTDLCRQPRGQLASRLPDWLGGRGASGMDGQSFHQRLGHVSQAGHRLDYRHRQHGGFHRQHDFHLPLRKRPAKLRTRLGYQFLFTYCSCAYLIAFAINHLLAPKFEPRDFPETDPTKI